MRTEFFLARMKVQRNEHGGRILLADNTGDGAVMLGPVRFHYVGVWMSAECLVYPLIIDNFETEFQLAYISTCIRTFRM
jgi:hypothetical protein